MKSQEHRDTTITDPPENVNDETVNELLSNTLLHLKFQDRNDIYEEIHGVRNLAREETPELIEQSLCSMAAELDRIISSSASGEVEVVEGRKEEDYKHAYQKTRQLEKTYVNDRDFHLKFLRADLFDAKKAADRLVVHLDFLLMLFGPRALEERLQASFFNTKEEAAALRSGNVQILPFRDRSGRRIMVNLSGVFAYSPYLRVRTWPFLLYCSCYIMLLCIRFYAILSLIYTYFNPLYFSIQFSSYYISYQPLSPLFLIY